MRIGRISLGLYNTYDPKRLHDIHIRTIARAAPVCYAFDFNLVLIGFPFKNHREELYNLKTTIGESGKYVRLMLENNRIICIDFPDNWFPSHIGEVVVATPNPDEKKKVDECDILEEAYKGRKFCIIIGLGRRGLPKHIVQKAKYHYEISGKNVEFETCTVIGMIPAIFYKIREIKFK